MQYSKLEKGVISLGKTFDYYELKSLLKVTDRRFQPANYDYFVVDIINEGLFCLFEIQYLRLTCTCR